MTKLQIRLAVLCAKAVNGIIRGLFRRNSSVFSGYIARLIFPDILPYMSQMVRCGIIAVTGTNGKTTVNNLICHILRTEGKAVLLNQRGANMLNGIVSAFVLSADNSGKLDVDYACIEVDEFAAMQLFPLLHPRCVLLTNIFRDQLDRYGETDIVCSKIRLALLAVPDAKLVINCDDFISYTLARQCGNETITYGINENMFNSFYSPPVLESIFCHFCGQKLKYRLYHYGHLGIYYCPGCGFKRPTPDYAASGATPENSGYLFAVNNISVISHADEPYNIYNTLSAYAALRSIEAPVCHFRKAVETFEYGNHREETFRISNARVRLCLAKNPVGMQQKISLLVNDRTQKEIIFQINDNPQDGRDVSWLWDVNFEYLKKACAAAVFTAGTRRLDMALRLKYEDISCFPVKNIRKLLKRLSLSGTGNIYVIVNYSGLSSMNRLLHDLQKKVQRRRSIYETHNRTFISRHAESLR